MLELRELQGADIPECLNIVNAHWGVETATRCAGELGTSFAPNQINRPYYYVAVENDEVVGFAGFKECWLMFNTWELIWVNVKKGHQKKGIGKMLTQLREAEILRRGGTSILLMTQETDFFVGLGFKIATHMGRNWYLMTKIIGEVGKGLKLVK